MDADTVPWKGNTYLEIWRHNNYISDVDGFMGAYMDHIEGILKEEPISIFARPTYLPVNFGRYYDQLWTEARVARMIELARDSNIAFEISTPMHVPKKEIIQQAQAAGIKFAFGTNARNADAGKLHYGLQMVQECRLSRANMLLLG
jgi:histidinol phosphatase-like PHP family hydrolase